MAFYLRRAVGIVITDQLIRFAVVGRKLRGIDVYGLHEHTLPEGIVQDGVIQHRKQLAALVLQAIRDTFGTERLPGRSVFILPWQLLTYEEKIAEGQTAAIAPSVVEVRNAVGLNESTQVWSAAVTESDNGRQYHVIVAPREYVEEWKQLFRDIRAPRVEFDIGSSASLRAVYAHAPHGGRILIRLFTHHAELSLIYDRMIVGVVSVPCDKEHIDRAVGELHTISEQLADVRDYTEAEKIVNDRIMPVIEEPMAEVIKATSQLSDHLDMLFSRRPQEALIVGHTFSRAFTDALQQRIGIWIRQAHTSLLSRKDVHVSGAPTGGVGEYIGVIGAAERILYIQWNKDLRISLGGGSVYATHLHNTHLAIPGVPTFGHQLRISSPQLFGFLGIMALSSMIWLMRGVTSPATLIQGDTWDPPELGDVTNEPLVTSDIVSSTGTTTLSDVSPVPMVRILETPTGWLNVRSGPSTVYDILKKVLPGESYELLEEQEEWYKIRLSATEEGWVIYEYVEKIQ